MVTRKIFYCHSFDSQVINFEAARPHEARTFLTNFRKRAPVTNLKGRCSNHAYETHKQVNTFGEDDYILPDHSLPIYKSNVLNYMEERICKVRDCHYVDMPVKSYFTDNVDAATALSYLAEIDETIEYMLDPISGSAARGKVVLGIVCIHVDDCFCSGGPEFYRRIIQGIKKDFEIGSEDLNDVMYCGQRVRWVDKDKDSGYITVDQDLKVEELSEITIPDEVKNKGPPHTTFVVGTELHSAFRSLLGKINWLQNRTRYDACYRFSRCASNSASPTVADIHDLNTLCRKIRNEHVLLYFHRLKKHPDENWRLVGYPDASYNNNLDKSSQRGLCIFIAEPRRDDVHNARGSLVEYESHKIKKVTQSTTVAELYAFMKCFGNCLFLRGLWMDMTATTADIHMRTDAKNLVSTAQTTHLPQQKETIHMIQMLRHEAVQGSMQDLAHVVSTDMMADVLTKIDCVSGLRALKQAVETGILPNVDAQPNFREMIKNKHKAFFCTWICRHLQLDFKENIVENFCGIDITAEFCKYVEAFLSTNSRL